MKYYKNTDGAYIVSVSTGSGGTEISEAEYNEILTAVRNHPTAPDGYGYRLRTDLTWELYELPPEPEELSDSEALNIILGGTNE